MPVDCHRLQVPHVLIDSDQHIQIQLMVQTWW